MGKYIYRAGAGLAFSKTKDIDTFAQLAKKGYRPVHLNALGFYRFEKCEPEDVIYAADCSGIDEKSPDFVEYREVFESAGWEFVYGKCGSNFFKAKPGTTPIYTDKQSEAGMYKNMAKAAIPILAVTLGVFALFVLIINLVGRTPVTIWLWALSGACIGVAGVSAFIYLKCRYEARRILAE